MIVQEVRMVVYDEETGKVLKEKVLNEEKVFFKDSDRGIFVPVHNVYENCDGEYTYDYCEYCKKPILQEEVEEGAFGCEYCKSQNHITINNIIL